MKDDHRKKTKNPKVFTIRLEEAWPENFVVTPLLRFVKREVKIDKETAYEARILQQMHQGDKGTQKWEDVPLIEDAEPIG
jgi:hypothetical protein